RVRRDQQPLARDPPGLQAVDLLEQHLRVDHDPVADDRDHLRGEYSRGQQVQRVALVADDHGVPGVVPALVADHVVDLVTEQVGGLALAFVTPLGADEHDGRHRATPSLRLTAAPRIADGTPAPRESCPSPAAPRTLSYVRAAGARAFRGYPNPAR